MYTTALREYVARHGPDAVTEVLDRVVAGVGEAETEPGFTEEAGRRVLEHSEW